MRSQNWTHTILNKAQKHITENSNSMWKQYTNMFHPSFHPHLLVVFNPHAEGIDKDGDHDPSVKVFTLHDPLQFLSEA